MLLVCKYTMVKRTRKRKRKRKTRKNIVLLPPLKKMTMKNKKYRYKLNDTNFKRRRSLNETIKYEAKKTRKTIKQAAIAKKGRLNILRIYRRFKKIGHCNTLTKDMKYLDKKYGLGETKNICGKKKVN